MAAAVEKEKDEEAEGEAEADSVPMVVAVVLGTRCKPGTYTERSWPQDCWDTTGSKPGRSCPPQSYSGTV